MENNILYYYTNIENFTKGEQMVQEKKKKKSKWWVILVIGMIGAIIAGASQSDTFKTGGSSDESTAKKDEEYFYKPAVEEYITTLLGLSNPDFSFVDYRDWEDGAGFIMVENTFKVNSIKHSYRARVGKDNVVYKLIIDGETVFSADADTLLEYMEQYGE